MYVCMHVCVYICVCVCDFICQEYILKAVVNAALGQDIGSVSTPFKTEFPTAPMSSVPANLKRRCGSCHVSAGSPEGRSAVLSVGWRLCQRMW